MKSKCSLNKTSKEINLETLFKQFNLLNMLENGEADIYDCRKPQSW